MQAQTVKRADARRNRGLILDAQTAFAHDGIDASLDEVARSAGVGPGTLYRHFPAREHLLCERQAALLSRRDEAIALACTKAALQCWMTALKDYLNAFSGLPRSFINAFEAQASPLAITCRILIPVTKEFLAHAQAEGAARSSVSAPALFLSALGAAFVHDKVSDYGTIPERVEEILGLGYLVDGSAVNTLEPSGSNTPLEHPMTQLSVGDQRHGRQHPGDRRNGRNCRSGAPTARPVNSRR